jgi:hypothetical protein
MLWIFLHTAAGLRSAGPAGAGGQLRAKVGDHLVEPFCHVVMYRKLCPVPRLLTLPSARF